MACFGKCNCGCCLTPGELASIASSVDIDWFQVGYAPGDPPADSTTNVPFVSDECCHTAKWIRGTCCAYAYECQKALEYIAEESITVSNKIIQSEKLVLNPGATVGQNGSGECIFIYDEPFPSADDVCDTEVNCGTVTKTYAVRETMYDAVGYDFNEVRVSIYKRDIVCTEGQPAECKVIVEVAQSVDVILGGSLQVSVERTKTTSDVFECCEEIPDCFPEKEHDPEINCDDVEDNTKFSFGANGRFWLVKYKVYDDIDEIPSEITFDAEDPAWPCGRIAFCGPDPGTPDQYIEGDQLCFQFSFEVPNNEGGSITQVAFSFSCAYCLDIGVGCTEFGGGASGYDCVRPPFPPMPCLCDHPGFAGQGISQEAFAMPGLGETYNTVNNSVFLDSSPCFRLINEGVSSSWPNDCEECNPEVPGDSQVQPAVPEALRTICNYWDCADCFYTFQDPAVAPYQDKIATVDAYSFTQSTPVYNQSPICIQFRPTKITLNP